MTMAMNKGIEDATNCAICGVELPKTRVYTAVVKPSGVGEGWTFGWICTTCNGDRRPKTSALADKAIP